jgi:hypothetical protein
VRAAREAPRLIERQAVTVPALVMVAPDTDVSGATMFAYWVLR